MKIWNKLNARIKSYKKRWHNFLSPLVDTQIRLLKVCPIFQTFTVAQQSLFYARDEPRHDKTNKMSVRPVKSQISLGIRPVWSESSLATWRKLGSLATQWAHSEDWLDWAHAQADLSLRLAHTHFVGFVMLRLILLKCRISFEPAPQTHSSNGHAKPSSGARCLIFGRTLHLLPYFMCANSKGSGAHEIMQLIT